MKYSHIPRKGGEVYSVISGKINQRYFPRGNVICVLAKMPGKIIYVIHIEGNSQVHVGLIKSTVW